MILLTGIPEHFLGPGYLRPWSFDADRAREPRSEHQASHAFRPWGLPPRTCAATGMVELTTLATAVAILREVDLALPRSSHAFRTVNAPLLGPHDGVPVERVRLRRAIDHRGRPGLLAGRAATATNLASEWQKGELPSLRLRTVPAGEAVVVQGAVADAFFVLLDGRVTIHKETGGQLHLQGKLEAGQAFCETGLLKNGIRTATVRAETDLHLLEIDRSTFLHLVTDSDLTAVEIGAVLQQRYVQAGLRAALPEMSAQTRAAIGDEFEVRAFHAAEVVFRQGDPSETLFMVLSGGFEIIQEYPVPTVIDRVGPGEFFGEMGIVNRQPRSSTVRAEVPSLVAILGEGVARAALLNDTGAVGGLALTMSRRLMHRLHLWQIEEPVSSPPPVPEKRDASPARGFPVPHGRKAMPDFDAIYHNIEAEISDLPCTIEGALPQALDGVFLRVGPGLFGAGPDPLGLSGAHGVVVAMRIAAGKARLGLRFPRTPVFEEERRAGRMTQRREADPLPRWWENLFKPAPADTASRGVFAWGGRIIAAGLRYTALDAVTLQTLGEERWGGVVGAGQQVCPRPVVDPATGRLLAYTLHPGPTGPSHVQVFELDAAGMATRHPAVPLPPGTVAVQGLAITPRWILVSMTDGEQQASLLILSRTPGTPPRALDLPGVAALPSLIAAQEKGDEIILDAIALASIPDLAAFGPPVYRALRMQAYRDSPPPRLRRYILDLHAGIPSAVDLCAAAAWAPCTPAAPSGLRDPHLYAMLKAPDATAPDAGAPAWFTGIGRIHTDNGHINRWEAGPGRFVGPPLHTRDRDGQEWVLTWVLNSETHTSNLVLLPAADLASGPFATIHTGLHLPAYNHMCQG